MLYPVTTIAASVLGLWLFLLSIRVIGARRNNSEDDASKLTFERRDRAQGNLIEYAPMALILLFLLEAQNAPLWLTALSAFLLVVGRLLHGYAFSFTSNWPFGRMFGTLGTFLALILLSVSNLVLLAMTA